MNSIKILKRLLQLQIKSQRQYPLPFLLEILSSAIILGFYFFICLDPPALWTNWRLDHW